MNSVWTIVNSAVCLLWNACIKKKRKKKEEKNIENADVENDESKRYLNTVENKFNIGDLFINGEHHRDKTPSGKFKITTLENSLLSIISGYKYKESYQTLWPIPKYQPTVEALSQYPIGLVL